MCGITGKFNFDFNKKVSINEIKKMTQSLFHRGPDDEGYFLDENVGLGFRRLSIIDLSSGHQPLSDNSGNYWITFNGEIYNYKQLRQELRKRGYYFKTNTDTEVIVNLYAEYKEKCVYFLRGMFAFIIWDKQKKKLFGARDRFGIKPLHYYIDDEKFIWGSEIKSIIASKDIEKKISLTALDYYFTYGYSQKNQTIFQNIKKLLPGHYFTIKTDAFEKINICSYWKIDYTPDYSKSESDWKESIYDTLNESVKMRMISDVPFGAFLSGGIDSSIVVSLMALNSPKAIKTFSIGFKEHNYNELKFARALANKYETEHHELIVEPESIDLLPKLVQAFDEPFADSSAIPTYYVSKFAREFVTVVLSGDGGDELFGGYNSYSKLLKLYSSVYNNKVSNKLLFSPINKLLPDYFYGKGLTYYLSKEKGNLGAFYCLWKDYERKQIFSKELNNLLENNYAEKVKINILDKMNGDFLNKLQYLDLGTYLPDDILTKVDIVTMLNSLEARVPLLDHKFAELSFTIPWELKLNTKGQKYILKETFKPLLPSTVISHKKQGFGIPLNHWFKTDLKEYTFDNLIDNKLLDVYFNSKIIKKMLNNHSKGIRDYSNKIWSLLFYNEWMKQNQ